MKRTEDLVRKPACKFRYQDVEDAVKKWNSQQPRYWLESEIRDNNSNWFLSVARGNPEALRELLEIYPEAIEQISFVAHSLAVLYRQAGRQSRKDSDAERDRRILAKLIPKRRGGRIAFPRPMIAQVWRHCYGIARELKAQWKVCTGDTKALLAAEPWLEDFYRRHYGQTWRDKLQSQLADTPYGIGFAVAAKILSVNPDTVRRAKRKFPGSKQPNRPSPTWWVDLPISRYHFSK